MIGPGPVGSYYGARLAETGHDVRFLVRRDYHAVRSRGLKVTSPDGDFTLTDPRIALNSKVDLYSAGRKRPGHCTNHVVGHSLLLGLHDFLLITVVFMKLS
jgi:hypothetical protein